MAQRPRLGRSTVAKLEVGSRPLRPRQAAPHAARDRAIVAAYLNGTPVARIAAANAVVVSDLYLVLTRESIPHRRPGVGGRRRASRP